MRTEADRERFLEEAKTAAGLNHDSIVEVYDSGEDNGTCFVVMEYMAGGSLASELDPESPMSPERIVEILVPIAEALHYIHKRKDDRQKELVHRDVKPANILLDAAGRCPVIDALWAD